MPKQTAQKVQICMVLKVHSLHPFSRLAKSWSARSEFTQRENRLIQTADLRRLHLSILYFYLYLSLFYILKVREMSWERLQFQIEAGKVSSH